MFTSSPEHGAASWLRTGTQWSVQILSGLDPWICALLVDAMLASADRSLARARNLVVLPVLTVLVKKRALASIPAPAAWVRSNQIDAG